MSHQIAGNPLDRRTFLHMAGGMFLLAGLPGGDLLPALTRSTRLRSIADLHAADFKAVQGETFLVQVGDGQPLPVRLDVVRQHAAVQAQQEWYALSFTGPKGQTFEQGSYLFAHPRLGRFELFVVPAMAVDHEERHIAIINRIGTRV